MLSVNNMYVQYGGVKALNDVSLKIEKGRITALLGVNGAGKSSLIKAALGLVRPLSGELTFAGERLNWPPASKMARKGLAYVPEGRGLFPDMTTYENLMVGAYVRKDKKEILADLEPIYETFPILRDRCNQDAKTLSGGEQQMLAIGRALIARPRMIMLDEPSLGLAPLIIKEIFKIIVRLRDENETTMLLVEQNAAIALKIADYAYLLEKGRIVFHGTSEEFLANDSLKNAYLGTGKKADTKE